MKPLHLRGRKTCNRIVKNGKKWRGKTMYIYSLPGAPRLSQTPSTGLYLGSFAPSSLNKSAVKRNYMRRRCREALRQTVEEFAHLPSMQILVSPRIASHSAPFDDILSDAQAFFSTLPSHVTKKKLSTT